MRINRTIFLVGLALLLAIGVATASAKPAIVDKGSSSPVLEFATVQQQTAQGITGISGNACFIAGNRKGLVTIAIPNSNIRANSVVLASVAEGTNCNDRHMGDAKMTVLNVVPKYKSAEVRIYVEWASPLPVNISYVYYTP